MKELLIVLGFLALFGAAIYAASSETKECRARGGVPVFQHSQIVCYAPGVVMQ